MDKRSWEAPRDTNHRSDKKSIHFLRQPVNFWLKCSTHIDHEIIVELFQLSLDQLKSGIIVCVGRKVSPKNIKKNALRRQVEKWQKWQIDKGFTFGSRSPQPSSTSRILYLWSSNIKHLLPARLCWKVNKVDKVNNYLSILASKVFGKSHPWLKADISVLRTHALKMIH